MFCFIIHMATLNKIIVIYLLNIFDTTVPHAKLWDVCSNEGDGAMTFEDLPTNSSYSDIITNQPHSTANCHGRILLGCHAISKEL